MLRTHLLPFLSHRLLLVSQLVSSSSSSSSIPTLRPHLSALLNLLDGLLAVAPPHHGEAPSPSVKPNPPPTWDSEPNLDAASEPTGYDQDPNHSPFPNPDWNPIANPNPLLQLDVVKWLLAIANSLVSILSNLDNDLEEPSPIGNTAGSRNKMKEELGLLEVFDCDGTVSDVSERSYKYLCLGNLFGFLGYRMPKSFKSVKMSPDWAATMNDMDMGQNREILKKTGAQKQRPEMVETGDFLKNCKEAIPCLKRLLMDLQRTLNELETDLQASVKEMMKILVSSHELHPRHVVAAQLRSLLDSYMNTCSTDILVGEEMTRTQSLFHAGMGGQFEKHAEEVIRRLIDPRGALVVGICGDYGVGKRYLASLIANDVRLTSNFPGGVFYLELGKQPDISSLQASLWKKMHKVSPAYSSFLFKGGFASEEEGITALSCQAQDGLPSLLVLNDVHEPSHLKPFMCFDSKDKGRVLVISDVGNVVLESENDTFVKVLSPLDSEEALHLLKSIVGCRLSLDWAPMITRLVEKCFGMPRLIEAIACFLSYLQGSGGHSHPSIVNLLKGGYGQAINGMSDDNTSPGCSSLHQALCLLFDALGEVHPYLQECFLDFAAFPKGRWISSSILVDMWEIGDRIGKERVLFALGFLASWSILEWRVLGEDCTPDVLNPFDRDCSIQWRLADGFNELAAKLNEKRTKESFQVNALVDEEGTLCSRYEQGLNTILLFSLMKTTMEVVNTSSELCADGGLVAHHPGSLAEKMNFNHSPGDPRKPTSRESDCRLFFPDWTSEDWPPTWIQGDLPNEAIKLSLISGGMTELSLGSSFSKLKVALFCDNIRMRHISGNVFSSMEQLRVLELKKCVSLTELPDTIGDLRSLKLLDLSECINLISVPCSISRLKNLTCLRMSGCLSLANFPESLGKLSQLETLDLSMCTRLRMLPRSLGCLSSLQHLSLFGCCSLQHLPTSIASLRKLTSLILSGCVNLSCPLPLIDQVQVFVGWHEARFMAIPVDCWQLGQLEVLHLCSLKKLTYLPQSVGKLQHLHQLNLSSCRSLEFIPDDLGSLFLLEKLDLSHTAIRKLPNTMGQLTSLISLCLRGCSRLFCIPPSICALKHLQLLELAECWDLVILPDELGIDGALPELLELDLSGCSIKQLPCFSVGSLRKLQKLNLADCQHLGLLPETFGNLASLQRLDLEGCKSLISLKETRFLMLKKLEWLSLRNCFFLGSLPVSDFLCLKSLKFLDVSGCTGLSPFPEPLLEAAREHRLTLVRWGAVWH